MSIERVTRFHIWKPPVVVTNTKVSMKYSHDSHVCVYTSLHLRNRAGSPYFCVTHQYGYAYRSSIRRIWASGGVLESPTETEMQRKLYASWGKGWDMAGFLWPKVNNLYQIAAAHRGIWGSGGKNGILLLSSDALPFFTPSHPVHLSRSRTTFTYIVEQRWPPGLSLERTSAAPHYLPIDKVVLVSSLECLLLGELASFGYLMFDIVNLM